MNDIVQITRTLNLSAGTSIVQILMMLLFMCGISQAQTVSYWFQGWQRKPDAQQAAAYFMVPGANVTFTYQTNRVIINSSGGGGGGNLQLFGDVTSPLTALPNVTATLATVGLGGTSTKVTWNTKGLVTAGTSAILDSADYVNQGTTTTLLHGNAAGNPSWAQVDLVNDVTGNLGVTHLDSGNNADNTHYWRGDGTWATIPAAAAQTNIYATNLIGLLEGTNVVFTTNASGYLSINNGIDTNLLTPLTYSQGVSNYTVSVSNLFKSISISNVIFSDDGVTNQAGFGTSSKSYGVAVGFNAGGLDYGISIGNSANGGFRGVAVGGSTIGGPDGVAIGYGALGPANSVAVGQAASAGSASVGIGHVASASTYGVAVGRYATVDGIGSAAIGGTDTSGNKAQVPAAWNDTIELARGVAVLQGGLNFRGMGIVDGNAIFYANYVNATNGAAATNGAMIATNFTTTAIKWVDMNINYALSASGQTAPSLTSVTNPAAGSLIKQLAFDNNDELFGQCQLPHTLAITNASFPAFYTEPHVHFDTIGTLDTTHSNVTWRVEWEWANINGGWVRGTNQATMGVTNNFTHYILDLGHITNNPPMNISAVFRCRLTRPASATQEYDSGVNSHTVVLDAFDLHVPIGNQNAIGSSTDNSP